MVDYHHIQGLIFWWKVIIWCRSTIIFYLIAGAMACRPVRVQTRECKDLILIWWIYNGYAPYFLFCRLHELVHVHISFGDHSMFCRTTIMAIVSPLSVASVASLTLTMTNIGATINFLQQPPLLSSQLSNEVIELQCWRRPTQLLYASQQNNQLPQKLSQKCSETTLYPFPTIQPRTSYTITTQTSKTFYRSFCTRCWMKNSVHWH